MFDISGAILLYITTTIIFFLTRYQTLDYRVRLQGGARHRVQAKRNYANYLLPYKSMSSSKPKTAVITPAKTGEDADNKETPMETDQDKDSKLDVFMFRMDRIPPHRQMFYQFLDIEVKEAQELMEANLKRKRSEEDSIVCEEKNGWYEQGTDGKLREMLTKCLTEHLAEQRRSEDEMAAASEAVEAVVVEDEEDDEEVSESEDDDEDFRRQAEEALQSLQGQDEQEGGEGEQQQ